MLYSANQIRNRLYNLEVQMSSLGLMLADQYQLNLRHLAE